MKERGDEEKKVRDKGYWERYQGDSLFVFILYPSPRSVAQGVPRPCPGQYLPSRFANRGVTPRQGIPIPR